MKYSAIDNAKNYVENIPKDCTLWFVMGVLGQKWNLMIILELISSSSKKIRSLSYSEIQERISGISTKVLSERLEILIQSNIIMRVLEDKSKPKKVKYCLDEAGKALVPIFKQLRLWGREYGNCNNPLCLSNKCRHALQIDNFIVELV